VLLNLGTDKQPSETKLTNTHCRNLHGLLHVLHRSDLWPAPVRPVTPVRPVDRAGQAGGNSSHTTSVPESLSDFTCPWNKNTPKTQPVQMENPTQSLAKQHQTDQEQISNITAQRHTSLAVHPRQIPRVIRTGHTYFPKANPKGKRTMKGSHIFPPSNPQKQGPKTHQENHQEGSENHHQEQSGTTHQSLEEPRRIIYTYQGGSYKV
jgi:hypothetical protein